MKLNPGDKVAITGNHPHVGSTGTLVSFGPYGLEILRLTGWYVRLDNGLECYANTKNLTKIK
jgi:hypothetical protein